MEDEIHEAISRLFELRKEVLKLEVNLVAGLRLVIVVADPINQDGSVFRFISHLDTSKVLILPRDIPGRQKPRDDFSSPRGYVSIDYLIVMSR